MGIASAASTSTQNANQQQHSTPFAGVMLARNSCAGSVAADRPSEGWVGSLLVGLTATSARGIAAATIEQPPASTRAPIRNPSNHHHRSAVRCAASIVEDCDASSCVLVFYFVWFHRAVVFSAFFGTKQVCGMRLVWKYPTPNPNLHEILAHTELQMCECVYYV